jgi:tetratricopeptide (TPR) repeat protein
MDELFGFNLKEIEAAVDVIVNEAYKYRESDPQKSRSILKEGLCQYPDNEILLNNLLYVLDDTKNPDETITIANSLIEKTKQPDIKYDALRFLAYAYKAKGDLKSAEAAIDQIPEIYFTKLTEMAYLLEGKGKWEAAEKQKWVSFENLIQMMEKVAEYYASVGMTAQAALERKKALKLIAVIDNSAYDTYVDFFNKKIKELK